VNVVTVGGEGAAQRVNGPDRTAISDGGKVGGNDVKDAQGQQLVTMATWCRWELERYRKPPCLSITLVHDAASDRRWKVL
jgi:hypothetical protein